MNYPRAGVSAPDSDADGWLFATATRWVEGGADTFDVLSDGLLELRAHRAAGLDAEWVDGSCSMRIVQVHIGPFRGLYRIVEVVDEVLTQGIVIGTGEGNQSTAEYRAVLDFDPEAGRITAAVRAAWLPRGRWLLPGGAAREARRHRELVGHLVESAVGRR